jgi:hypothetical protein
MVPRCVAAGRRRSLFHPFYGARHGIVSDRNRAAGRLRSSVLAVVALCPSLFRRSGYALLARRGLAISASRCRSERTRVSLSLSSTRVASGQPFVDLPLPGIGAAADGEPVMAAPGALGIFLIDVECLVAPDAGDVQRLLRPVHLPPAGVWPHLRSRARRFPDTASLFRCARSDARDNCWFPRRPRLDAAGAD